MTGIRVGVLGASGDIGQHLAEALLRPSSESVQMVELRLAARRPERITNPKIAESLNPLPAVTVRACDVRNREELEEFVDGLTVVVNATGPSHRRALDTASIILAAGADYVDVGGPADARTLAGENSVNRISLFYAGALPGASGILPRWLLNRQQYAKTLTVITGGRGSFTQAGAEDYLAGLKHGDVEPLASWRAGSRVANGAHRQENIKLEEFPDPVSLFPYFDADSETIARESGISEGTWYSAMVGEGVMKALVLASGMGLEAGSKWLRDASVAMVAGRRPYVIILAETENNKAMLHAPSECVLAAEFAAAATKEVLARRVPAGYASAARVLDPELILATITHPETACTLVANQGAFETAIEEGEL